MGPALPSRLLRQSVQLDLAGPLHRYLPEVPVDLLGLVGLVGLLVPEVPQDLQHIPFL